MVDVTKRAIGGNSDRANQKFGGARRDRTADLLNAIQALSQLSYSPPSVSRNLRHTGLICQAPLASMMAIARLILASVRDFPKSSKVASIEGDAELPVSATRSG